MSEMSEKLSDQDRYALDLMKSRRQVALAEAKTAISNGEVAELSYKNLVLQLFMKYGLTIDDVVNEDGSIVRGGNKKEDFVKDEAKVE